MQSSPFQKFRRHHKRLMAVLKKCTQVDALIIICGDLEKSVKNKVQAFAQWYVGQELEEVIFFITRNKVILLAGLGLAQSLEFMKDIQKVSITEVTFLKTSTKNTNNQEQIAFMFQEAQKDRSTKHIQYAFLLKEPQSGLLQNEFDRYIRTRGNTNAIDASKLLSQAFAVKDRVELGVIKNSALLTVYLSKKLLYWSQQAIDKQEKVQHYNLTKRTESFMKEPSEQQIMEHHCQLIGPYGLSYLPVVQSGGQYDVSQTAQSNREIISADCIIVQLGTKYRGYHTNCVRTMLINPSNEVRAVYNALLSCHQELVDQLKPGVKLGRVYRAVRQHYEQCLSDYSMNFPECIGWGTGLQQYEDHLAITRKSRIIAQVGMCFYVQVWVEGVSQRSEKIEELEQMLQTKNINKFMKKNLNFTLCVGDTVCIADSEANLVLTNTVEKLFKKIAFYIDEDQPSNTKHDLKSGFLRLRRGEGVGSSNAHNSVLDTKAFLQDHLSSSRAYFREIQIKEMIIHQEKLKSMKQFDLEERLFGKNWPTSIYDKFTNMLSLTSYKVNEAFPERAQRGRFFIDPQALTVLIPFGGTHIPFHALTIKNVELDQDSIKLKQQHFKEEEGIERKKPLPKTTLHKLHIRFWTTENSFNSRVYPTIDGEQVFIKEMVFKSSNLERFEDIALLIKNLQKQARLHSIHEESSEKFEKSNNIQALVDIEPLMSTKNPLTLQNVKIRPALSLARNLTGLLECHLNGLKYKSTRDEEIVIPFRAIKHYIFQAPMEEIIGAVHVHLHNPIIVGRRRVCDVQFYREVPGAIESMENKRKKQLTSLDLEFEAGVLRERYDMNLEFERFIESVEQQGRDQGVFFEKPIRSYGFEGNWNRARLFLQPTQNCLVNVVESPFFIISFSEIDVVCFERIMTGVKTYDQVFVYKNYEKGWIRVESIDRSLLEMTQQWLDQKNVLFFQVSNTLMWKNMLFTITRDFKSFVHEGGWSKLMVDQVDHAPLHNFKDDGSSVFEPNSSDGETSFSLEIPELDEPIEQGPKKNIIWEEESVSQIEDSGNIFGFNDVVRDSDEEQLENIQKTQKKLRII